MNDVVFEWVVTAVAAVVVLYLIWRQQHDHREWQRKCDREDMLRELRRDLSPARTEDAVLVPGLQRRLDQQRRILNYVSRRLS